MALALLRRAHPGAGRHPPGAGHRAGRAPGVVRPRPHRRAAPPPAPAPPLRPAPARSTRPATARWPPSSSSPAPTGPRTGSWPASSAGSGPARPRAGKPAAAPPWLDADQVRELAEATRALAGLAAERPWADLPAGAMPRVSFLLRDHPHYRVMRTVADAIDDSLRWSPIPGDPAALGLRTQTLNALFEVWVSQAVRAAVRRRLGLSRPARAAAAPGRRRGGRHPPGPGAGLLRPGLPEARARDSARGDRGPDPQAQPRRHRRVVADRRAAGGDGRRRHLEPQPQLPRRQAGLRPLAGRRRLRRDAGSAPLCTRRSLVVFPGPRPEVHELGFALSLATVSAPPSEAGWELLGAFLDRALEGVVPGRADGGRFHRKRRHPPPVTGGSARLTRTCHLHSCGSGASTRPAPTAWPRSPTTGRRSSSCAPRATPRAWWRRSS